MPHVAALIAATLVARFPIGINALALVLYLRAERGSFAVAGAVAGALAAGSGIGAPVQGRLVDAFGQRRVLVPLGIVHAAALGALVASTEAGPRGGPRRLRLRGRLRDPADLVGAALDVAGPAARAAASCCRPPTRSTRC